MEGSYQILKIIREKWSLVIPILLILSSFVWITPLNEQPNRQIPNEVLLLSQIVGIICSLLLGLWCVIYFKIQNYWPKAGIGVFGICLTGFIANFIAEIRPYIFYTCVALQFLWLIYAFIYKPKDKNIADNTEFRKKLDEKIDTLFGKGFLRYSFLINTLMGLAFFLCAVSVGWGLLNASAILKESQGESVLKELHLFFLLMKTGGISFLFFLILFTLCGLIRNSIQYLVLKSKSSTKIFTGAVLPAYLVGIYVCSLWFLFLGRATNKYLIMALASVVPWTIICGLWLGYLHRIVKRFSIANNEPETKEFQSAKEFIRNNCKHESTFDDRGIIFSNLGGEKIIQWENIKNVLFHRQHLSIIDQEGQLLSGQMSVTPRRLHTKMEKMWDKWYEHIANREAIDEFEFPDFVQKAKQKKILTDRWMCIIGGPFLIAMSIGVLMTHEVKNSLIMTIIIFLFMFLFGVTGTIMGICGFIKKPKVLSKISLNDGNIVIGYTNGDEKIYARNEIKKCSYRYDCGFSLYLTKGSQINNLDTTSYFSCLRQKLLEIIKTSQSNWSGKMI